MSKRKTHKSIKLVSGVNRYNLKKGNKTLARLYITLVDRKIIVEPLLVNGESIEVG